MPVEFLSGEQVARFGRFAADPSPLELERFFRLNGEALSLLRGKRRDENRLGFAVQWGTVRMLGAFLAEDPTAVPSGVAAFVAEQLAIPDPGCLRVYAARPITAYEHQWEIRRECGYREFAVGEAELLPRQPTGRPRWTRSRSRTDGDPLSANSCSDLPQTPVTTACPVFPKPL